MFEVLEKTTSIYSDEKTGSAILWNWVWEEMDSRGLAGGTEASYILGVVVVIPVYTLVRILSNVNVITDAVRTLYLQKVDNRKPRRACS